MKGFTHVEGPRPKVDGRERTMGERATVYVNHSGTGFLAVLNGRRIGAAMIDTYSKPQGPDTRNVFQSEVLFPREGIGTRLYDAAEAALKAKGLRLAPSPSHVLSDEAWEFWRRRAPELLQADARKYRPQYMGRTVEYEGDTWAICHVMPGAQGFLGRRADKTSRLIPGNVVHAAHGAPDEDAATLHLFEHARAARPPAEADAAPAPGIR